MTRDENLIRSEDELRSALRSLERHAPTLESVLAVLDQPGGCRRRRRTRPANRRQLGKRPRVAGQLSALNVGKGPIAGPSIRQGRTFERECGTRHAMLHEWNSSPAAG